MFPLATFLLPNGTAWGRMERYLNELPSAKNYGFLDGLQQGATAQYAHIQFTKPLLYR